MNQVALETTNGSTAPVAVLGAGLAGLAAAAELRRRGREVMVFEAGKQVAGLAGSHRDAAGFTYDTGAHFITNRLATAIGVNAACRTIRYYGESVWLGGRPYSYPFGLAAVPRFAVSALKNRLRSRSAPAAPANARDWFIARYGEALAREVALPLVEAWSGVPADQLSPAVGDKIPASLAETVFLRLAARWTKRAVAIGYGSEKPQSMHVWHVYPEGGVGVLCRTLADRLDGAIRLESPIETVIVRDNRVQAVRSKGVEHEVSGVISTAPINILPKLVTGAPSLERFRRFRFRPMIFVNLLLEGRGLLPNVVLWTPEARFPFFRLTEAPLSTPWLAPEGKTTLTVDIGAEIGDPNWAADDAALAQSCLEQLAPIIPDIGSRYIGQHVIRVPIAYPVFLREYDEDRRALTTSTGVDGLLSIGRNGEFGHWLMEDVYWRTLAKIRRWTPAGAETDLMRAAI